MMSDHPPGRVDGSMSEMLALLRQLVEGQTQMAADQRQMAADLLAGQKQMAAELAAGQRQMAADIVASQERLLTELASVGSSVRIAARFQVLEMSKLTKINMAHLLFAKRLLLGLSIVRAAEVAAADIATPVVWWKTPGEKVRCSEKEKYADLIKWSRRLFPAGADLDRIPGELPSLIVLHPLAMVRGLPDATAMAPRFRRAVLEFKRDDTVRDAASIAQAVMQAAALAAEDTDVVLTDGFSGVVVFWVERDAATRQSSVCAVLLTGDAPVSIADPAVSATSVASPAPTNLHVAAAAAAPVGLAVAAAARATPGPAVGLPPSGAAAGGLKSHSRRGSADAGLVVSAETSADRSAAAVRRSSGTRSASASASAAAADREVDEAEDGTMPPGLSAAANASILRELSDWDGFLAAVGEHLLQPLEKQVAVARRRLCPAAAAAGSARPTGSTGNSPGGPHGGSGDAASGGSGDSSTGGPGGASARRGGRSHTTGPQASSGPPTGRGALSSKASHAAISSAAVDLHSAADELVTAEPLGEPSGELAANLSAELAAVAEHAQPSGELVASVLGVAAEHAAAAVLAPSHVAGTAALRVSADAETASDVSTGGSDGDSADAATSDDKHALAKTPPRRTTGSNVSSAESTRSLASSAAGTASSDGGRSAGTVGELSTHGAALSRTGGGDWLTDADDIAEVAAAARDHMEHSMGGLSQSLLSADVLLRYNPSTQYLAWVRF